MSFLFISKTLQLNNLKTRTAMDTKITKFVICVKALIYLLLSNLHDCTFAGHMTHMHILMTFCLFSFENVLFWCLFFFHFSLLHLNFSIYFYILALSQYLWNINWEVLQLAKLRKPSLSQFLTLANTLDIMWLACGSETWYSLGRSQT